MFLLSRLDEVSRLFPHDVEGTREFLLDRGIPAGSLDALTHFSARLMIDPSFRRDVTSLVQVVIQREDEAVDYLDLLGILVFAAAGSAPVHANDEQEESVREILRFLTQIPRPTGAVGPVFVPPQNVPPPLVVVVEPAAPDPPARERDPLPLRGDDEFAGHRVSSVPFSEAEESKPWRWRGAAAWLVGGVALGVAPGGVQMFYQKSRTAPQTTAALQTAPSPSLPSAPSTSSSVVPSTGSPIVDDTNERATTPAGHLWKSYPSPSRKASPAVARHWNSLSPLPAEPLSPLPAAEQAAPGRPPQPLATEQSFPAVKSTSPARPSAIAKPSDAAKPSVVAENNPASRPFSAVPNSAATSTPPANTASSSAPDSRRRLPKYVEINPAPLRRPGGLPPAPISTAPGVVHPASIGMMASNLISSPAPEYPAAATQARVQGEVTVRAVVDRDGNVTDARVISGPELLRDVSLEAVQHWRFRPYMQGGKPVEVATTAVLDFQLP